MVTDRQLATLNDRGVDLLEAFEASGESRYLDDAIGAFETICQIIPFVHPNRGMCLTSLAGALNERYGLSGDPGDLLQAGEVAAEAVAVMPSHHPQLCEAFNTSAAVMVTRYELKGNPHEIEAAIGHLQTAVRIAAASGHHDHGVYLANLATALLTRYDHTSDPASLQDALVCARDSMRVTPVHNPRRWLCHQVLCRVLSKMVERGGGLDDMDEAIRLAPSQIELLRDNPAAASSVMAESGRYLRVRFERLGDLADLDKAIDLLRGAAEVVGVSRLRRGEALGELSMVLQIRCEHVGSSSDNDESIVCAREALSSTTPRSSDHVRYLSALALGLWIRFEQRREIAALDEAMDLLRTVVELTPSGHPLRAGRLANLGGALTERFLLTKDYGHIEESIDLLGAAVAAVQPDHQDHASYVTSLVRALDARADGWHDRVVIDDTVQLLTRALSAQVAGPAVLATLLTQLGVCLGARSKLGDGDAAVADVQRSVEVLREAAGMLEKNRVTALLNLATALAMRAEILGRPADLEEALDILRQGSEQVTAPTYMRIEAARGWGALAATNGLWDQAANGFAAAVELLPVLAWRGLDQSAQEHALAQWAGICGYACASLLQTGHTHNIEHAVEVLEHGRRLLFNRELATRYGPMRLQRSHPRLAARLSQIGTDLEHVSTHPAGSATSQSQDDRHRLAAEWDRLIAEVRTTSEFSDFLRQPNFDDLRAAGNDGPVIIVNVSPYRSDALVVANNDVRQIPLPDLDMMELTDRAMRFIADLETIHNPWSPPDTVKTSEASLTTALEWLWDAVAGPILTALALIHNRTDHKSRPRVWWCPIGLLSFLPLHAAGYHARRNEEIPPTVMDNVISSYTPDLQALLHARSSSSAPIKKRSLIVAMPTTPGATPLPFAAAEADLVRKRVPRPTVLKGRSATRDRILRELQVSSRAHFACHVTRIVARPSDSHLQLHDGNITLGEIARLRIPHGELAFLSACSTFRTSPQLADESIHLAGAFQLAGYTHAIATLWPIPDDTAFFVADHVTAYLDNAAANAATVLQDANHRLREQHLHQPSRWMAFIHSGP